MSRSLGKSQWSKLKHHGRFIPRLNHYDKPHNLRQAGRYSPWAVLREHASRIHKVHLPFLGSPNSRDRLEPRSFSTLGNPFFQYFPYFMPESFKNIVKKILDFSITSMNYS